VARAARKAAFKARSPLADRATRTQGHPDHPDYLDRTT
jgi:hypothetical protein